MKMIRYLLLYAFMVPAMTVAGQPVALELAQTSPSFEVQQLFESERFPNIVTTTDGTLLAAWGSSQIVSRRSTDGGRSWQAQVFVAEEGFHGGGLTVDDVTGHVLAFVEMQHPPAPLKLYRSHDQGQTWQEDLIHIHPDTLGAIPSMHMNEHGLTMTRGNFAGRLIRATRVYAGGNDRAYWTNHYTNAMYSDNRGNTWHSSHPFPVKGTGEAAIVELQDGTLYYNSRRHMSTDGNTPRRRYSARSRDGGHTWIEVALIEVLPDGPQDRDYGLMAGLVRLPIEGRDVLLYSNVDVPEGYTGEIPDWSRQNMRFRGTIWISFDGGQTWPLKKLVEPGPFAYSSLTAGRPGTPSEGWIYLLYENERGGKVARFNLAWLLADAEETGD